MLMESRHYVAWRHGSARIDGGYAAFRRLLIDKLVAHGGEVREHERVDRILMRRRAAVGVRMSSTTDEIGADQILAACDINATVRLLADRAPMEDLLERVGEPTPEYFRYTLNVVLEHGAIPPGMGHHLLLVRDPRQPLTADNCLRVETSPADAAGHSTVCVEALLPRRGMEDVAGFLMGLRDRIMLALREVIPFMDASLVLVDSPHDGRDALDVREAKTVAARDPWGRGPSTMSAVHRYPPHVRPWLLRLPRSDARPGLAALRQRGGPGLGYGRRIPRGGVRHGGGHARGQGQTLGAPPQLPHNGRLGGRPPAPRTVLSAGRLW
jgi:hypothetical protein